MPPNHAPPTVPTPADRPPIGLVLVGDRLQAADAPAVRVDDRGFLYGDGIFETIRVVEGRPWHLDRHLRRLESARASLGIGPLDGPPIAARIATLLTANELTRGESAVRITITRGPGASPRPGPCPPTVVLTARALDAAFARRRAGIPLRAVEGLPRALAHLKSLCYLPSVLALAAVEPGEEPLLVDPDGAILEGATSNVFARFGDRLVTPPADGRLLPGVARSLLMERAATRGLHAETGRLTVDDLTRADGVWLTNALLPCAPATALDGRPLPRPAHALGLSSLFDEIPP